MSNDETKVYKPHVTIGEDSAGKPKFILTELDNDRNVSINVILIVRNSDGSHQLVDSESDGLFNFGYMCPAVHIGEGSVEDGSDWQIMKSKEYVGNRIMDPSNFSFETVTQTSVAIDSVTYVVVVRVINDIDLALVRPYQTQYLENHIARRYFAGETYGYVFGELGRFGESLH